MACLCLLCHVEASIVVDALTSRDGNDALRQVTFRPQRYASRQTMSNESDAPEVFEILDDDEDVASSSWAAAKPKGSPAVTLAPVFAQAKASSSRPLKRRESSHKVKQDETTEPDMSWTSQLKEDVGEDAFAEPASKKRKLDAVKEAQP